MYLRSPGYFVRTDGKSKMTIMAVCLSSHSSWGRSSSRMYSRVFVSRRFEGQ